MRRSERSQRSGSPLQQQADSLALYTWPAELKPQARAPYRTGRAQRLLDFVAEHPGAWQAKPNVHLAFPHAPVDQRLYMDCHLDITEYVHRWSGNNFARIREREPFGILHAGWMGTRAVVVVAVIGYLPVRAESGEAGPAAASANDKATTVKAPCSSRHVTVHDRTRQSAALGSIRDRRLCTRETWSNWAGIYAQIDHYGALPCPLARARAGSAMSMSGGSAPRLCAATDRGVRD